MTSRNQAPALPAKRSSPIDRLFDQVDMHCTICGQSSKVGCGCWTPCPCGWHYRTGLRCRNPVHPENAPMPDSQRTTSRRQSSNGT